MEHGDGYQVSPYQPQEAGSNKFTLEMPNSSWVIAQGLGYTRADGFRRAVEVVGCVQPLEP